MYFDSGTKGLIFISIEEEMSLKNWPSMFHSIPDVMGTMNHNRIVTCRAILFNLKKESDFKFW